MQGKSKRLWLIWRLYWRLYWMKRFGMGPSIVRVVVSLPPHEDNTPSLAIGRTRLSGA